MGLFHRIFGRGIKKLPYPPALQTEIESAMHHLQALTAGHDDAWRIGKSQWNVDQDKGTIVFTTPRGMKATAPVQIIGTYNTEDSTWLWGWDHPSIVPPLADHAKIVFAYGQKKGYDVLTTRKLRCPVEQGWEFTALACKLCNAQGGYRGPMGNTRIFMTFGKLTLSP